MSQPEREPCPGCGEPVPLATTACPFCKASLLVDVVLAAPVTDERIRYQLARALAALGPPAPDFSAALRALEQPVPVIARGLSHLAARRLAESLAGFGFAATVETAGAVAPARSPARRLATVAGLGAVVVGGALLTATREGRARSNPPPPRQPASLVALARSIPWRSPSPPLGERDLAALAAPAAVEVRCGGVATSGFFVAPEEILTRMAGPDGCAAPEVVLADGRRLRGEVQVVVAWLGLARMRVEGARAEPLEVGDVTALAPGGSVSWLAAGSGLHEARVGQGTRQIQGVVHLPLEGGVTDGAVGGPVLARDGRVVGIVAGQGDDGEALFVPINYAYQEARLVGPPRAGAPAERWRSLLAQARVAESLRTPAVP